MRNKYSYLNRFRRTNLYTIGFVLAIICYYCELCGADDLENVSDSNTSAPDSVKSNNNNNIEEIEEKSEFAETETSAVNNNISRSDQKDPLFSVDKSIFENYLKNVSLAIIPGLRDDDDLDHWIPSKEIQRDVPMYMSGFDSKNRPIWIIEIGKWKLAKYATGGVKSQAMLDKYLRYLSYAALKSQALRSTSEHRVDQHVMILDLEGSQVELLTNPTVLRYLVKVVNNSRAFGEKYVGKRVILNVGQVSEALITVSRFLSQRSLNQLEIYGRDKSFWAPRLLQSFPKDQLPEWYGGIKGFQPLYVIG